MVHIGQGLGAAVADTADELAQVDCPIDRAARISILARTFGTLSPLMASMRVSALVEARRAGYRVCDIAARLKLTPGRVSQLTADGADHDSY